MGAMFLGAGAIFTLVWSMAILVSRRAYRARPTLALMFCLAGLWQAGGAVYLGGYGNGPFGFLTTWFPPFLFLLGPVMYRYYRDVLLEEPLTTRSMLPHALPVVLALVALLCRYLFAGSARLDTLRYFILGPGPKLSILLYLSFLAFRLVRAVFAGPAGMVRLVVCVKLLIIYASLALGAVGYFTGQVWLRELSALSLPAIIFVSFILAEAEPSLLPELGRQVRGYSRTRLRALNTDRLRSELDRLMLQEKAFSDEDLSLTRLALEIELTPHQLSEYLNRFLGKSFSDFVNDHRVDEAQRLILAEPDRTTLSIAHAVGFNSRSAFYRAFRRRTGTDPSRFRAGSVKDKNRPPL